MKFVRTAAAPAAVSTLVFGIATAAAQGKPTLEETYRDIESVCDVTPEYMKVYPKQGIAAVWALTKALEAPRTGGHRGAPKIQEFPCC